MQQKYDFYTLNVALEKFYKVIIWMCKSVNYSSSYANLFYSSKAVLYDRSSG